MCNSRNIGYSINSVIIENVTSENLLVIGCIFFLLAMLPAIIHPDSPTPPINATIIPPIGALIFVNGFISIITPSITSIPALTCFFVIVSFRNIFVISIVHNGCVYSNSTTSPTDTPIATEVYCASIVIAATIPYNRSIGSIIFLF